MVVQQAVSYWPLVTVLIAFYYSHPPPGPPPTQNHKADAPELSMPYPRSNALFMKMWKFEESPQPDMDKHLFCIMGFSTETQKLTPGKGIKGGGERGVGGLNSSY